MGSTLSVRIIVLLLVYTLPREPPPVCYDVLELNSYCGTGEQLILWDWSPDYRRLFCQGWLAQRDVEQLTWSAPYRFRITHGPHAGRVISARILQHTVTVHDPEVCDRAMFPTKYRRPIR